jgi:hypothetical protein
VLDEFTLKSKPINFSKEIKKKSFISTINTMLGYDKNSIKLPSIRPTSRNWQFWIRIINFIINYFKFIIKLISYNIWKKPLWISFWEMANKTKLCWVTLGLFYQLRILKMHDSALKFIWVNWIFKEFRNLKISLI